jgi:division protein CdvB (Snf7/Vps24/ESCRT-III family)
MTDFNDKWTTQRKQSFGDTVRENLFPPKSLKNKIEGVQSALQSQISNLDARSTKIRNKESVLENKVVTSIQKHDKEHASAYSSELAETRKMMRTVTQTKMILEQITLRMGTVHDLGDFVVTLSPAVSVIKGIRSGLNTMLPEVSSELGDIGNALTGLVGDVGQLAGMSMTFEPGSEDAEKILAEAAAIAERKTSEKIPDLPVSTMESVGLPTANSNT